MSYSPTGNPATGAKGLSALMRAEFVLIGNAFANLPAFLTTGVYTTTFDQQGNYTFALPAANGALAMLSDVASSVAAEAAGRLAADAAETAARTSADATLSAAITAEVARATAAEASEFDNFGRNRVDNGNCEVAQRTLPVTANAAYSLDRWVVGWSAGAGSVTQTSYPGYTSRKQLACIVVGFTAGSQVQIITRIEAARAYDLVGKQVTLQFNTNYTISAGSTSFSATLYYPIGAADTFGTVTAGQSVAFTPSGTPGTYTCVFTTPLPVGAANGIEVLLNANQSGATGDLFWVVTSVQLEAGAVATPFERIDPMLNLQRCQKFCFNQTVPTQLQGSFTSCLFPATMHHQPTSTPSWNIKPPSYSIITSPQGYQASVDSVSILNSCLFQADL